MEAQVIDLQSRRKKRTLNEDQARRTEEALEVLRVLITDYEILMKVLAPTVSAEELVQFLPLSPEEQRAQDLRRLHEFANALEGIAGEKRCTLSEALEVIQKGPDCEMKEVAHYLLGSEFPLFGAMLQVIEWSSLPRQSDFSDAFSKETRCEVKKLEL
jgi:hypothetical protein